jgi:L-amino acid N-acyltransferase YncA
MLMSYIFLFYIIYLPIVLVDPVHRRKGVASLLIRKSLEELKKVGARKLYANVYYQNRPSMMLFTKMGFVKKADPDIILCVSVYIYR